MRRISFAAVVFFVVAGLMVWAPLSWASGNCAAMGAMCEGPCGASSCVTAVGGPTGPGLPLVGALLIRDPHEPPSAVLTLLELPPRSSLLFS